MAIPQNMNRRINLKTSHPDIKGLEVMLLEESGKSLDEVSRFIESCWDSSYTEEPRIHFSKDFLDWNLNQDYRLSFIGLLDGNMVGCLLGFPIHFRVEEEIVECSISTALSTVPSLRGKGLSQHLYAFQKEKAKELGIGMQSYWLDPRMDSLGSSYQTYVKRKKEFTSSILIPFYGKSFDYNKAVKAGNLSFLSKVGVKASAAMFPSFRSALPGYEIQEGIAESVKELEDFVVDHQLGRIRRDYSQEPKRFDFKGIPVLYILQGKGGIRGAAYGLRIPCRDTIFLHFDCLLFHPDTKYGSRKGFLSNIEAIERERHGSFGAVAPSGALTEGIMKFGYIPVSQQVLSINTYDQKLAMSKKEMKSTLLELR